MLHHKRLVKDDYVRWQNALSERGWMAPGWPVKFGGTGWSPIQRYIFEEEMRGGRRTAVSAVRPAHDRAGDDRFRQSRQQSHFLPRILRNEDWWCQGYSEPGAGSDLASLKTRAELKGDHYIVNGQKTWNTLGQWADMCFCLVRTSSSGKKQEGISFLLIDMHAPGRHGAADHHCSTASTRSTKSGSTTSKVPVENLVGDEGRGWTIAKFCWGTSAPASPASARRNANCVT